MRKLDRQKREWLRLVLTVAADAAGIDVEELADRVSARLDEMDRDGRP